MLLEHHVVETETGVVEGRVDIVVAAAASIVYVKAREWRHAVRAALVRATARDTRAVGSDTRRVGVSLAKLLIQRRLDRRGGWRHCRKKHQHQQRKTGLHAERQRQRRRHCGIVKRVVARSLPGVAIVRSMAKFHDLLWDDAIQWIVYMINYIPSKAV